MPVDVGLRADEASPVSGVRSVLARLNGVGLGTYITTLALSVLILVSLQGTPLDQGLVNASRWTPCLLFGLLAGIWIDRYPRRTVLAAGDLGRGAILAGCPVRGRGLGESQCRCPDDFDVRVWNPGPDQRCRVSKLSPAACPQSAADQGKRPAAAKRHRRPDDGKRAGTLAPPSGDQPAGGQASAQTAAPSGARLHRKIAEGLRWVYAHEHLAPLAWSSHIWFIGTGILGAVLPALILSDLGLGALGLGLVMGCAGVGAVVGTTMSTRLGHRWGTGRAMVVSRLVQPVAIALVALSPLAAGGLPDTGSYGPTADWPGERWAAFLLAGAGQLLFGMAMGVEGPLEMGYRQAVTPDRLIARMSATLRSVNRGMIVIGAPLGGLIASVAGSDTALSASVAFLLLSSGVLLFSKFREARIEVQQLSDEEALR